METKNPQPIDIHLIEDFNCGLDGTRTRDPVRDRHVF